MNKITLFLPIALVITIISCKKDKLPDLDPNQYAHLYYEPTPQQGFNISSNGNEWIDAELYNELWRTLLQSDSSSYMRMELLGVSSENNIKIYRYDFKPKSPTRKVILFGGNHGSEKIPPITLYRFFKDLIENSDKSSSLKHARQNIHFIVVPLLSPDGFNQRNRRVKETKPFPARWSKVGNRAIISFDIMDFPLTNPNISPLNYFSNQGIIGKTWLSVMKSSDQFALPENGYIIQSALNGQTIMIESPDIGGSNFGSCEIYVSTDPNRNLDMTSPSWYDFSPGIPLTRYTEQVSISNSNKGTKPYSLSETKIAKDLIDKEHDATFLIDFHNGADNYDIRWSTKANIDRRGIVMINHFHKKYTNTFLISRRNSTSLSSYASRIHRMNGFTAEWGKSNVLSDQEATDCQRWFGNIIIMGSWFYSEKYK